MKKITSLLLVLIICFSSLAVCQTASAAGDAVKIGMSFDGIAVVGEEMTLRITVGKPTTALAGLEFVLDFQGEYVTPIVDSNNEDGSSFDSVVTKMPNGWEQICSYSAAENRYYFRFAMPDDGKPLSADGEIVIDLPFTVKAAGMISFKIPSSEIMAFSNDEGFSALTGKGEEFSTVAASENERFAIDVGNNDTASENGLYLLNITITNIGDSEGIIGLEFGLRYNPSYFKPYITKNDDNQMDAFIKSSPDNAWEQMCTLDESDSKYTLRLAALHAESTEDCEKLEIGKSIKLTIPFMVVGKEGESGRFVCNTATTLGINNKNKKIGGVGDLKTVSIGERTSPIPQWIYNSQNGYIFAPDNTQISQFLSVLSDDFYVTENGEKITEGVVKTDMTITNGSDSLTIVVRGDINCNGIIDSMDYVYAKRIYYGTYKAENARFQAAAVSNGESVNSMDYVYIKRHYFGTYNLSKQVF